MTQQQIMLNRHCSQKIIQDHALVGSEVKNPLPTHMHGICAKDLIGLSWIFTKEDDFDIC